MRNEETINGSVKVIGTGLPVLKVTITGNQVSVNGTPIETKAAKISRHKGTVTSIYFRNFSSELKRLGIIGKTDEILSISSVGFEFDATSNSRTYIEECIN